MEKHADVYKTGHIHRYPLNILIEMTSLRRRPAAPVCYLVAIRAAQLVFRLNGPTRRNTGCLAIMSLPSWQGAPHPEASPETREPPRKRLKGQGDAQRVGCVDSKSTNGSSNSGSSSRRSSFPPPTSRSSTAAPRSNGHDGAATRSSGRTGGLSGWADVRGPPPSSTAAVGAPSTSPNRRRVSFQGAQGVRLDFNYWVGQATSSQVLTSDIRKLVMATLAKEPAPPFVEALPKATKVVVACVSGLDMAAADMAIALGACPFLRSCSSVPVRHSLDAGRGGAPRAMEVQPGAALMLWDEKPMMTVEEMSTMSLTEIFSECELTFSGSKSPGWKDDVSFHPSKPGGDGGDEAEQPEGPKGPEQGKRAVCRGKFWRNLNRDRGRFALFREERKETESEDGAEEGRVGGASSVTWVLHLQWDRWDAETLLLRPAGRGLRFEAKDQSLSLVLSCARRLTNAELIKSRQSDDKADTGSISSSPGGDAGIRVVVVDSSGVSDAPADAAVDRVETSNRSDPVTEDVDASTSPAAALSRKPNNDKETVDGTGKGDKGEGESKMAVIRVPMESLNPAMYCLTAADRYRLSIPVRASEEGPGYVSTDQPMPPSPSRIKVNAHPREDIKHRDSSGVVSAEEEGEAEEGELEDGELDSGDAGQDQSKKVEEGEVCDPAPNAGAPGVEASAASGVEGGAPGSGSPHDAAEIEGGPTVPSTGDPAAAAAAAAAAQVGAASTSMEVEGDREGEEDGEIAAVSPRHDAGDVPVESAAGGIKAKNGGVSEDEEEEGEIAPAALVGFVAPSSEKLCPISSGPRKGVVILGVDCEMVYTADGLELARATMVNVRGETVYDELVRPTQKVTDHNTQFSGITPEMLQGVSRTLRQAQREILSFVTAETFLVGHSVDSDLRALKLVHRRLIDTSELYPSARGTPFKNGLRVLSQTVLGRAIQDSAGGHDSKEDAFASLELALLKMHRGPAFGLPPVWASKLNPPRESIFESLERRAPGPLRCAVSGDLEARASAEHPARTPLWSVFNCGYRREQDAVWAGRHFIEMRGSGRGEDTSDAGESSAAATTTDVTAASSGENGSPPPAQVTVEAAHFPTAGGMFRDALGKLSDAPSLLWVDLPCDRNDFDEEGGVNGDAALWASKRRDEKDLGGDNGNGGNNGGDGGPVCEEHWTSLAEVDSAMSQLYGTMAEGTLLVVVCQGALSRMISLVARRTKAKWDANKKEKQDFVAGQKRDHAQISTFDRQDENELVMATSECLNGMCFLASK